MMLYIYSVLVFQMIPEEYMRIHPDTGTRWYKEPWINMYLVPGYRFAAELVPVTSSRVTLVRVSAKTSERRKHLPRTRSNETET